MHNLIRKYFFILNPISGNKKDRVSIEGLIKNYFSRRSDLHFEIKYTEYAGHARELALTAVQNNADVVVAVGGDGTLNETAAALVHTKTNLGIVPRGSGNGFARSLKIPLNSEEAIKLLLKPQFENIDVGLIDGKYFFNVAGVGFDADISAQFQQYGKRGPFPYFYLGVKAYLNYKYEKFNLISDEGEQSVKPLLITLANTKQYGAGAIIAPEADYRDGLLEVCIVNKIPFHQSLKNLRLLFNGKINTSAYYRSFKTNKLQISRPGSACNFHTDGEPQKGSDKLEISMLRRALSVCVPEIV